MAFNFDNIISGAKDLFDKASEKAGEAIDYSKNQIDRSQYRVKLKEKYQELGKIYYESCTTNTDKNDEISKLFVEIGDYIKKLEETETASKKEKICPNCGTVNDGEGAFCTSCGSKL